MGFGTFPKLLLIFISQLALAVQPVPTDHTIALARVGRPAALPIPFTGGFLPGLPLDFEALAAVFDEKGKLPLPPVSFLWPNELFADRAIPLFKMAPTGVYVAVGTDRGFNNVSLTPGATHLLLIDLDPQVVYFNLINTWLLKVATSREDYLNLRLHCGTEEWAKRAAQIPMPPEIAKLGRMIRWRTLSGQNPTDSPDEIAWNWWQEFVRNETGFRQFHGAPLEFDTPFSSRNYLFQEDQFNKLHQMAKRDRIESHYGNLEDASMAEKIANAADRAKLKLAVLDISNAWIPKYVDGKKLHATLSAFRLGPSSDTLVITTNMNPRTLDFEYASNPLDDLLKVEGAGLVRFLEKNFSR